MFLRATTIVVGSSAAMLIGGLMGTAHADPAPLPAPDIGQQLIGTAAQAPQALQNLAGALGGQPATPPPLASASIKMPQQAANALPGASSLIPGATAPSTSSAPTLAIPGLTQPASTAPTTGLPGYTSPVPAATTPLSGIPGLTSAVPAAAAPATGPAGMLPQAQLNLPQIPGLPFPLPQQVSLPGDLTSLFTGASPLTSGLASAAGVPAAALPAFAAAPAVAAPAVAPNPLMFPVVGLP
jgi:hypothetical protein